MSNGKPIARNYEFLRPEPECGTPAGYRRHRKKGEKTCQPCRDAIYVAQGGKPLPPKPCEKCGIEISGDARRKYCDPCAEDVIRARDVIPGRCCEDCGVDITGQGRHKLCEGCADKRKRNIDRSVDAVCPWCGGVRRLSNKHYAGRACSTLCNAALMLWATGVLLALSVAEYGPPKPPKPPKPKKRKLKPCKRCRQLICTHTAEERRTLAPIPCDECGEEFAPSRPNAKFCSRRCRKRRQRAGDKGWELHRQFVYDRDGLICQICLEPCDTDDFTIDENGHYIAGPRHPSIDHIVRRAFGGGDEPENLRTAHHGCNSEREDWSVGAQLAFC